MILETDREDSDEYGRLLRYLVLPPPDGRLVNLEMVRKGHARVLTRFPFSRKSDYLREEERVRREGAGVWADGGMAELRWLAQRHPDPVRVHPAGGGRYAVVHDGWGKPGIREKEVGREAGGYYELLSGAREGERVVTSANFLIDSESKLKSAVPGKKTEGPPEAKPEHRH